MHPLHIVYLNGPDIESLALSDQEILAAVEGGLAAQGRGQVVIEPRVQLVPANPAGGRFNISRGVIQPLGLAGIKVAGEFADNAEIGLPCELAVLTLFDPATGMPLAVLNATSITAMRSGAMTALGAKYLARTDSKILGHIGARGTSYWNIRLLDHLFAFEEIRVHSMHPGSRQGIAAKLSKELGRTVIAADDLEGCVRDADIIVEAARRSEPQPVLKTGWIRPGALVIPCGTMSAVDASLVDIMDEVVVDELGQIVAGARPGRESESETILFRHSGSGLGDIALASAILDKAGEMSIGQTLRFE